MRFLNPHPTLPDLLLDSVVREGLAHSKSAVRKVGNTARIGGQRFFLIRGHIRGHIRAFWYVRPKALDQDHESISLPRQGLDEARILRIVAERFTNLPHHRVDAVLHLDEPRFTPQRVLNLAARDQLARARHQQAQELHGLILHFDQPSRLTKLPHTQIEFEGLKADPDWI